MKQLKSSGNGQNKEVLELGERDSREPLKKVDGVDCCMDDSKSVMVWTAGMIHEQTSDIS